MQLDRAEKGFSFREEGPLDMRMNPDDQMTAEEIVNHWSEKRIQEVIRDFGEEPRWKRAAEAIVRARRKGRITTTKQLSKVIEDELKTKTRGRLHPATLVFQGLRIAVNGELDAVKSGIEDAIEALRPGGIIGVISFHRLEDRIVKEAFRGSKEVDVMTKKPLVPSEKEVRVNPRSRSAKLRFARKC